MRALLCVVAIGFGCGSKDQEPPKAEKEPAAEMAKQVEEGVERARQDADAAMQAVQKLQGDADALAQRMGAAVDALANAQNDADRESAKAALQSLQKEKAELDTRIAEAKAKAARAERLKGVKISKECLGNPLAKGCQ